LVSVVVVVLLVVAFVVFVGVILYLVFPPLCVRLIKFDDNWALAAAARRLGIQEVSIKKIMNNEKYIYKE